MRLNARQKHCEMSKSFQASTIFFRYKQPIVKLRFTIETRAYRRLSKSEILTAPLGARAHFVRFEGVFSVDRVAEKTDFIKIALFYMILYIFRCGGKDNSDK